MKSDVSAHVGAHKLGLYIAVLGRGPAPIFLPLNENLPWKTGAVIDARVISLRHGSDGGGGFCKTTTGENIYLRHTRGLHEGQMIQVKIQSEARGIKLAQGRQTSEALRAPTLQNVLTKFGNKKAISVASLETLKKLRIVFPKDRFEFGTADLELDNAAESALHEVEISTSDLTIVCEATQTAHHIDINGQGRVSDINLQAADLAINTIISRNLGGIILIDFLPPPTKLERQKIAKRVEDELSQLPHRVKVHAMNESGHLIIERQRLASEFLRSYFGDAHG